MPYLNWKTREIHKSIEPQPRRSTLTLGLRKQELTELLSFLEEVYLRAGAELRLDLPAEWIVFWKTRESESRLLLAHPQKDEWVATVALEAGHGQRLVERLREALGTQTADTIVLTELGSIGSVSNVEIVLLCSA